MKDTFRLPSLFSSQLERNWPFWPTELSKLMDQTWGNSELAAANFSPRIDIKETPTELRVAAELPGVEEKDIKVEFHDNTLSIKGEKQFQKEEKDEAYHRVERSFGSFMRQISLPDYVDAEKMAATFKNGVLTVTIGKRTNGSTKRTIEIKK